MNLYEISQEYQGLLSKDEYTADDLAKLDMLDTDVRVKSIAVAAYILNRRAELLAMCGAIHNMEDRASKLQNKIESLSLYLKTQLLNCGINAITDHPEFEIKIKTNPPKLQVFNEAEIPVEYRITETVTKLNNALIKDTLKSKIDVPGAQLIQETRLELK